MSVLVLRESPPPPPLPAPPPPTTTTSHHHQPPPAPTAAANHHPPLPPPMPGLGSQGFAVVAAFGLGRSENNEKWQHSSESCQPPHVWGLDPSVTPPRLLDSSSTPPRLFLDSSSTPRLLLDASSTPPRLFLDSSSTLARRMFPCVAPCSNAEGVLAVVARFWCG